MNDYSAAEESISQASFAQADTSGAFWLTIALSDLLKYSRALEDRVYALENRPDPNACIGGRDEL